MSGMQVKGEYILQTVTWREDREAQARGMKELIRCKDCIHHKGTDCETWDYRRTADDFYCGYAERKEE